VRSCYGSALIKRSSGSPSVARSGSTFQREVTHRSPTSRLVQGIGEGTSASVMSDQQRRSATSLQPQRSHPRIDEADRASSLTSSSILTNRDFPETLEVLGNPPPSGETASGCDSPLARCLDISGTPSPSLPLNPPVTDRRRRARLSGNVVYVDPFRIESRIKPIR